MSDEKILKQLKASRGYAKASLTRLYQFAHDGQEIEIATLSTLQAKRSRVAEIFSEYEGYNKQILAYDEYDTEDVADGESKYFLILSAINEAIKSKGTPCSDDGNPAFRTKLPKIEIQPFCGKYSEYTPFINLFRAIIHKDRAIDNIQKLYYLRTFLQKEPFDIIKNLPLQTGSYEEALRLLDERYNHKFKIVNEHINSLLDMNALVKSTSSNLREFVSLVKQCLASLKNLQVNTETWDPIVLSILFRKLDSYTSRAYQLERSTDSDPTVLDFLAFMEKRALALENAAPLVAGKPPRAVVNIAATPGASSCAYCKSSDHKLFACNKFKVLPSAERIKIAKEKELCNVCLNIHRNKCKFHFRCNVCKQAHNTLLHDDEQSPNQITLISNTQTDRVLLPTVKIKLYSQNGTEVHVKAILDSASQVSLVTSKVIEVLGITPNKDGTTIVGVSNTNNVAKYSVPLEVFSLATPYRPLQPCFINTRFGHVIAGALPQPTNKKSSKVSLLCLDCKSDLDETLQQFFETEKVPEMYTEKLSEHDLCENSFQKTTVLKDNKFQLDTVTYGQKSSSFLATRCLHELATKYKEQFPLASYILSYCTYVDDACYSHSDIEVILEAKRQLIKLLGKGSFFTHKWASNCQKILEGISLDKQQFDDLDLQKNNVYMKTLGLTLNVAKDFFSRPKWRDSVPNVKVGDLVILREPNSPPLAWPMARIIKIYAGLDNKVRVLDVITPNKRIYKRSLSGICILPLE
ncbi:Uncharacterized protein OBRU01_16492 [Operophtera brumata]|uniref:DUF5641 domain-containing protein n=1 Tax=Operophtera brumata TaxID=104452 RepID=A0A0L7L2Y3_OPEBR|nr:Uncharacterized protein OBRU01_16492 [Operophtera brumata]